MFSLLLRVLTIAGTCTVAAVLTRKYILRKAEQNKNSVSHIPGEESDRDEDRQERINRPIKFAKSDPGEIAKARTQKSNQDQAEAASSKESVPQSNELENLRKKRDEMQSNAQQVKQRSEDRSEKIAKSKQAALAAQEQVKALRKEQSNKARNSSVEEKAQTVDTDFSVPAKNEAQDPAKERARVIIQSSRKILDSYKQPEGLTVDLSLAVFSMETAERLLGDSRFDEAWEKAGAVGMIVSMAEMRAAIEKQLKELKGQSELIDKLNGVRSILTEADKFLAEASKSFVADTGGDDGFFMKQLQSAFQKTMQAQAALAKS